jgi:hypothetical protein
MMKRETEGQRRLRMMRKQEILLRKKEAAKKEIKQYDKKKLRK